MEVVSTTDQAGGDSGDQCCGVDQWLPACPTSHLLNNILIHTSQPGIKYVKYMFLIKMVIKLQQKSFKSYLSKP